MKLLFYILINILIIALFLYSKLVPYKDKLTGSYSKIFNLFESIFNPLLYTMRKLIKPSQVGNGIAVDMSQIVLLIIFLALLKFIL